MLLLPPANRAPWFGNLSTMSCISLAYFSGTLHSLVHLQISSLGTLLFADEHRISGASSWHESKL